MDKPVLRDYQTAAIHAIYNTIKSGRTRVACSMPTGSGKCLARNTPILMWDGNIKLVQDIVPGDLVTGDDDKPRTVLDTCHGKEEMFKITPVKGDSWVCNRSHTLSLVMNSDNCAKNWVKNLVYDITVEDYLKLPKSVKHCLKQYRSGVNYDSRPVSYDAYSLGVWLGDGTSSN